MMLLIAFALFALIIVAWVVAPGGAPAPRDAEAVTHSAMPELRTHAA